MIVSACGTGVRSDPPGLGVNPGSEGPHSANGEMKPVSGNWSPCGHLGTGGPVALAVGSEGPVAAILFADGRAAIQSVAETTPLRVVQARDGVDTALSPDGARVAVAGPSTLAAWSVSDGDQLFDLQGAYGHVVFSPDGQMVLARTGPSRVLDAASTPPRIELRRAADGSLVHELGPSNGGVLAFAFNADGTEVGIYERGRVSWYAADSTGAAIREVAVTGDESAVGAALSPHGKYLAILRPSLTGSSYDFGVDIYDAEQGTELGSDAGLDAHEPSSVTPEITFAPDDESFAISVPGWLWVLQSGTQTYAGPQSIPLGQVPAIAFNADAGMLVARPSGVYRIAMQPNSPATRVTTLAGQGLTIMAVAASADGKWLAASSFDVSDTMYPLEPYSGDILVWDLPGGELHRQFHEGLHASSVSFAPDGEHLLVAGETSPVQAIEQLAIDGADQSEQFAPAWLSAYGPSGSVLFSNAQGIQSIPLDQGVSPAPEDVVAQKVAYPGFDLSSDGQTIATSGPALWRLSDFGPIWSAGSEPEARDATPTPIADNWVRFSPDGRTLLVSDFTPIAERPWKRGAQDPYTTRTRLYGANDGHLIRDFGTGLARRPVFSPDGAWMVAGNVVYAVNGDSKQMLPLSGSDAAVSTFTPDGTIVVAREDGILELFCPR